MKSLKSIIFLGITLFFTCNVFAQNGWITDEEMKFKIQAPANYRQSQTRDGSDKVLSLVSPDENVMVRVRAMPATSQFTAEVLQRAFEQNMIQGANRIMNENGDLHGIPALASAYTWKVNNDEAVLGIYYIIQNGFAYVVWTAVPRNLLQQRSAESDGILNTFTLLKPAVNSSGGGLLSGLGNVGNSNTKDSGNSTPTSPPSATKSANPDYLALVSDDACIEHLFPKNYKQTSSEQGQAIWEDGSGIKMIQQNIFKQGDFRNFMSLHVQSIQDQGAQLGISKYLTVNNLDVFQYFYEYGNTFFAYSAVENNAMFYLLGFVGDKSLKSKITQYSNHIKTSYKKADCPDAPQIANSSASSNSTGVKTATLTHLGFDFSTGQKENADGETISWCPDGNHPNYTKGVWWRASGTTQYKNLGNINLNSVSSVPASWDKPAVPLLPGNVYVIKCNDGYAAIKVISVDENNNLWPTNVEYKFTSGNTF